MTKSIAEMLGRSSHGK